MSDAAPILLIGAGRMGGALVEGWLKTGAFAAAGLIIRDPNPSPEAVASGARINPPDAALAGARTVLLAVKPQLWREAAAEVAPLLAPDAVILSIAAGVRCADIGEAFGGRAVARVMPTTGVAIAKGVASIFAGDEAARARAHDLFEPVATCADLADEAMMDAATAVSGSGPAYLYAFVEAVEAAALAQGFDAETAARLARATVVGAAALLDASPASPADLRRQVTSPAGTTEAALKVLIGERALEDLVSRAVQAAADRSRELS